MKIKSQNGDIFIEGTPHYQILTTFCFIKFFDTAQPRGPSKSSKRGAFPGLQNKKWELGVVHKTKLEGDHQTLIFHLMQCFDAT